MDLMSLVPVVGGAGALALAYVTGRYVYDDVTKRVVERDTREKERALFEAKLNAYRQRQALKSMMHIPASERGSGLMVRWDGTIVNPDTKALFGADWQVKHLEPIWERVAQLERVMLASSNRSVEATQDLLPEVGQAQLPTQISLKDVLGMRVPTLDSLTLGVTVDEGGQIVPVTRSLYQLMHLLAIGVTGAGKSTWLLTFLAQIQMCKEDIEVVLVDTHGAAFNICSKWSKLRYPIARDNEQAKLVLEQVILESKRRAALFPEVPEAEDLASYNRLVSPEQRLCPWLVVIDEGTLMLGDSSIAGYVAQCVQGTRQYGLYVFMTGQTGNTTVVKSPIRANFPTRVCWATEKPSMVAALGAAPPRDLEEIPGRGWARLKGSMTPIEMQAPYIRRPDFSRLIEHEGPRFSMPDAGEKEQEWTDAYLRETWNGLPTKNKSAMCRTLGEETGGAGWGKVNEAGRRAGLWE